MRQRTERKKKGFISRILFVNGEVVNSNLALKYVGEDLQADPNVAPWHKT
jgi:hypothetical protein